MSIVPPGLILLYVLRVPALRFAACRAKYNRRSAASELSHSKHHLRKTNCMTLVHGFVASVNCANFGRP